MTDPITTPAQMREAAALLVYGRCAKIIRDQDGKIPEVDQNLRIMAAILPDIAAMIRALPVAEPAPVAVRVKPLVWDKDKAETPLGVYIVVCEDWDEEPFWFVLRNGKPAARLGEHSSADAAQAAANADHAARILSQIEAIPAAQVRAEALREVLADDEMCLRLAEGYDREDAAQRGEPSPHTMGDDGYAEWAADRIACAKEGLRAIRALMEKPE